MNITLYLAENNMALWGKSGKLYTQNNEKYLGLIQLLAKFDPLMQDHISHILKGELADCCCGKSISKKLNELMVEKVRCNIISCTQSAKSFLQ
jgi:mRNA-degrading endonuclease YafQ of YafQ-DinJ toxin-antitoxin module